MDSATILYDGREAVAVGARVQGDDLWLPTSELSAATGWELKPEGMCKGEICVPVPEARHRALVRGDAAGQLVNLTEFARHIQQPFASDRKHDVWYFGAPGWEWKTRLASGRAPDFTLPDMEGQAHSLSDWQGHKRLLLFWATW